MHRIISLLSSGTFQDLAALAAVTIGIYGLSKMAAVAEAFVLAARLGQ